MIDNNSISPSYDFIPTEAQVRHNLMGRVVTTQCQNGDRTIMYDHIHISRFYIINSRKKSLGRSLHAMVMRAVIILAIGYIHLLMCQQTRNISYYDLCGHCTTIL